jgi:hypothetical protein
MLRWNDGATACCLQTEYMHGADTHPRLYIAHVYISKLLIQHVVTRQHVVFHVQGWH